MPSEFGGRRSEFGGAFGNEAVKRVAVVGEGSSEQESVNE